SNGKLAIAFARRGYSPSGGAEAYLKRLAQGVVDLGYEARLVATDDWPTNEWSFGSITRVKANSAIGFADELKTTRPQLGCDVLMSLERVWCCNVYRAGDGVHQAWLNRRRRFEMPLQRFVRSLNRNHRDILQLEESLFARGGAGRVIANSEMVRDEIVDLYRYPADKIDIVRNGVPLDRFRSDPALREKSRVDLKLKPDEVALLFAGSGWERKGLRFAIEAIELCRDRKLRLLVAGRGNERDYKPRRFFTEEPVRFLGEVADLRPSYAAADIFILPTIYDPFSNACLEALASGLPVITTRANGFCEVMEDRIHGSMVDEPDDIDGLRNAIEAWRDPTRRRVARPSILNRAAQFDISRNVERTLQIVFQSAASAAST